MADVLINDEYLTDIANAIRAKSGSTDTYKPKEMAAAIEAISTSSGGEITPDDIYTKSFKDNWTSIELPTATRLDQSFYGSKTLQSVYAPMATCLEYDDFYDNGAFDLCSNLVSFKSDQEEVEAQERAFAQCTNLTDVGDSWYKCGLLAFFECENLERVKVSAFDYDCSTVPMKWSVNATAFKGSGVKVIDIRDYIDGEVDVQAFGGFPTAIIFRDITKRTDFFSSSSYNFGTYYYVPSSLYSTYINYADDSVVDYIRKIEDYPDICG